MNDAKYACRDVQENWKTWPLLGAMAAAGLSSVILGGCSMMDNYKAEAETDLQYRAMPLVTRSAKNPDAYYALGKYYFYQGRMEQAKEAFLDAIHLDPAHVDALNGLGIVYDREGRYDSARKLYDAALLKDPQAAHVWANLGYSLILAGKIGESLTPLQKAVALDPVNEVARQHLAGVMALGASPVAAVQPAKQEQAHAPTSSVIVTSTTSATPVASVVTAQGVATVEVKPKAIPALQSSVTSTAMSPPASQQAIPVQKSEPEIRVAAVQARETVSQPHPLIESIVRQSQPVAAPVELKSASSIGQPQLTRQDPGPSRVAVIEQPSVPLVKAQPVALRAEPAISSLAGGLRIEVSNGNGVNGLARAIGAEMSESGMNVTRITNAKPFNKPHTLIMCRPELKSVADELARSMSSTPKIVLSDVAHRRVDVRVVLGADTALAWKGGSKGPYLVASLSK